ncbi:acidic mammalian chitinase-like [Cynoglossus semilaevis]|uniref:acidic mammalian chitinase-like n=1 Tax=Cynoglossus semilaevis TaxID=244447 RepID=UPI000D62C8B5|nr:acidic mammalian chitinase-like [Cynoglossus semilaevis]
MSTWRDSGAPAEKLLMGIAAYGRTFTLTSATNNGVAAPTSGVGEPGLYTGEGGFWSYYEVCYNVPLQDRHWSEGQEVPYGSAGTTWVGFDNPDSVEAKANVIKTYNYGGAAVWAMDLDDFRGEFCNQGPYPLTTRLHKLLVTDSESSTTTTTAADNTGQTTTTAADNTGQTTTTAADNTGQTTTTAADKPPQLTTLVQPPPLLVPAPPMLPPQHLRV